MTHWILFFTGPAQPTETLTGQKDMIINGITSISLKLVRLRPGAARICDSDGLYGLLQSCQGSGPAGPAAWPKISQELLASLNAS